MKTRRKLVGRNRHEEHSKDSQQTEGELNTKLPELAQ
jgi:hypothetical protein